MAKGKHKKEVKSEKAKVKLKGSQSKTLPKGLNVTNPSFKVKKIVIREQLKTQEEDAILSRRKLNVKDLLSRLQHYNSTVRREAIRELKEMLSHHAKEILGSQLHQLLQGICGLSLDTEKDIRRDSLKVLTLILSPISNEQLAPFAGVLILYLKCAMTHINPNVKEDSLSLLDVLVQNCGNLLARHSHEILPNFLDMIARLQSESRSNRQLTTTLNNKNTSAKWRIKVFERLVRILSSMVLEVKSNRTSDDSSNVFYVDEKNRHVPIFNSRNLSTCQIYFDRIGRENSYGAHLHLEELKKYVSSLLPLMFDSWIEVCPSDVVSEVLISSEASVLLKHIVQTMQLIVTYLDSVELEKDDNRMLSNWCKTKFYHAFVKTLFGKFPYSVTRSVERVQKRQEDFEDTRRISGDCLEENLDLCYIFVWFTSVNDKEVFDEKVKENCVSALEYLSGRLKNWNDSHNYALPTLAKFLRILFLRTSKIWYRNRLNLGECLGNVIEAHSRSTGKEIQSTLFSLLSDIVMDHNLNELHCENSLRDFLSTLPTALLQDRVHDDAIKMLNRVVLRYRKWIEAELTSKQEKIIENAKTIEIIGSQNEKESRLAICNLFYFIDAQIYY